MPNAYHPNPTWADGLKAEMAAYAKEEWKILKDSRKLASFFMNINNPTSDEYNQSLEGKNFEELKEEYEINKLFHNNYINDINELRQTISKIRNKKEAIHNTTVTSEIFNKMISRYQNALNVRAKLSRLQSEIEYLADLDL